MKKQGSWCFFHRWRGRRSAGRPAVGAGHPAALHPGAGGRLHRQEQPHQAALPSGARPADLLQMQRRVGAPERALLAGVQGSQHG